MCLNALRVRIVKTNFRYEHNSFLIKTIFLLKYMKMGLLMYLISILWPVWVSLCHELYDIDMSFLYSRELQVSALYLIKPKKSTVLFFKIANNSFQKKKNINTMKMFNAVCI